MEEVLFWLLCIPVMVVIAMWLALYSASYASFFTDFWNAFLNYPAWPLLAEIGRLSVRLVVLFPGYIASLFNRPCEPDYTDFFPVRSSVVPYQLSPPQGGSVLASGKLTTQEAANALALMAQATHVSPNSYVEPYSPPMRYLASVEEDAPVMSEAYADDGKAIPGDDEWQQFLVPYAGHREMGY